MNPFDTHWVNNLFPAELGVTVGMTLCHPGQAEAGCEHGITLRQWLAAWLGGEFTLCHPATHIRVSVFQRLPWAI